MRRKIPAQITLLLSWLISLAAAVITLYGSEVLGQAVCHLCWYQRIFIYPLVIILGIASYRADTKVVPYAILFPIIGFLFASYQYLEQMIPNFNPVEFCSLALSCSITHFKLLGFITYPFLSMIACVMIFILLLMSKKES